MRPRGRGRESSSRFFEALNQKVVCSEKLACGLGEQAPNQDASYAGAHVWALTKQHSHSAEILKSLVPRKTKDELEYAG
jgi:hypothetical protein